jgi:hypothetical protein
MQNVFEMSTLAFAILYILVRRDTFVNVTSEAYLTAGAHAGSLSLFARSGGVHFVNLFRTKFLAAIFGQNIERIFLPPQF